MADLDNNVAIGLGGLEMALGRVGEGLSTGDRDSGLELTEEALRKAVRGSSHQVLQKSLSHPVSELDIPLCRMIPMTDVRVPLRSDIAKLKGEFVGGYRKGVAYFYVALKNYSMEERSVSELDRHGWSPLWREQDLKFEALLQSSPELSTFSDKYFFVWDGNHRHIAWNEVIDQLQKDNATFYIPVKAIILDVTNDNRNPLLNAMTDWNKHKESDHVAQKFTHDLKRVQHFGLLDFDHLKGLINEEDYLSSVMEWNRKKEKKWYYMTQDAFVNFMYERDIIAAQEEDIRKYKDSLVTGVGEDKAGSLIELVRLCSEAVAKKKTACATIFNRYLAIANPANGDGFLREVFKHYDIYQTRPEMLPEKLQLICTAKVGSKFKERWCRWWNMSKESREEYNFPPYPASNKVLRVWIDQAAFWAGLEEECEKRYTEIVQEDHIVLKTNGLPNPVQDISSWIESYSISLWGKAFKEHFGTRGQYTKGEEFLAQVDTEKVMKRAILRYFWRELILNGALERNQLPIRFKKWIDTSSAECIFTDAQRRRFSRHHLIQCPWYIELRDADPCPSDEVALKASCEALTLQSGERAEDIIQTPIVTGDLDNPDLTERQKTKLRERLARVEAKAKEKEDKRLEREAHLKERRETTARNKHLAALVRKEGPDKPFSMVSLTGTAVPFHATSVVGISPSASSRPPFLPPRPSQTVNDASTRA